MQEVITLIDPVQLVGMMPSVERRQYIEMQSFHISPELDLSKRRHAARPYNHERSEEDAFDLLTIDVPSTYQQGLIADGEEEPHGMLRVVAAARGWDSQNPLIHAGIYDAHRLKHGPDEIRSQLTILKPRLVGLNPTSVNVAEAQVIAALCDELEIPYILGGIHATLDPATAQGDFPGASAFVRGNGEAVIGPLVQSLLTGAREEITGVYYPGEQKDHYHYAPKLNPGMIPPVDKRLLVEAPVYTHPVTVNGATRVINEATLHVTEGCPFECKFCSSPVQVGRGQKDADGKGIKPYTRPAMERIIDEIEHCLDIGADAIHFLDDMAFVTPQHIDALHEGLKERGLLGKFIWRGLTRAPVIERFSDETMQKMVETGVWKIALGVESGNDEVLRAMKKQVTTQQVLTATEKLAAYGIQMKGFFIMGFPGETREQIEDTVNHIRRLKELGMTEMAAFQFKPYPGTEYYKEMKATHPDVLRQLGYLRRAETGLSGKAQFRVEQHDTWLPPQLMIASIPSSEVQQYVEGAIEEFYGDRDVVYSSTADCI